MKKRFHFAINRIYNNTLGIGGSILDAKLSRINISANKPARLFYGMQTLMQLFPNEIENQVKTKRDDWLIPCVKITDYPWFGYAPVSDASHQYMLSQCNN